MNACMRCSRVTDAPRVTPYLRLCQHCPKRDPATLHAHGWHGTVTPGTWVCVECGTTIGSEPIHLTPAHHKEHA